jgi:hypothetical protein
MDPAIGPAACRYFRGLSMPLWTFSTLMLAYAFGAKQTLAAMLQ